ncbi:MAG: isochorismatase family cysteine hydrolase [Candidatus Bathyarchaeia archaeon]
MFQEDNSLTVESAQTQPSRWLILCIDMQKDFYYDTAWKVKDMPRIIPKILSMAKAYGKNMIYTRFINPENKFFSRWKLCIKGTKGAEIIEELKPFAKLVFDKPGYSCMKNIELVNFLLQKDFKELYFVGIETDACIYASMLDAFEMGFDVYVVRDAVTSSNLEFHKTVLEIIKKQFGNDSVIDSKDLLNLHKARIL